MTVTRPAILTGIDLPAGGPGGSVDDPTAYPDALGQALLWLRSDPSALTDLRRSGWRNARRYPLSGTARALRALSDEVQRGSDQ